MDFIGIRLPAEEKTALQKTLQRNQTITTLIRALIRDFCRVNGHWPPKTIFPATDEDG